PLTAAMTGLPMSKNSVMPANPPGPWSASIASPAAAAFKSQPAQKKRSPAPVRIPARSRGSRRSRSNASYSALLVATSTALALGRSRVTTSTWPSTETRTGSDVLIVSPSVWPQQGTGDDVALYFAGAVPDALHARISPPAFHRQVAHQSHPAEDLHRGVGDVAEHLRRVELGHGGVAVGHRALVQACTGPQRQQLRRLQFGSQVRELETDPLDPADRLTELM